MRSLLQITNDILYLFVSAAGFCIAVAINCAKTSFNFFHYVFYQQVLLLLRTFMWLPISIAISVLLQLLFLPLNIPLKLFGGTSLQKIIIGHTNSKTNTYVLITIFQYALVLLLFGVIIGLCCGAALGIIHFIVVIPDMKFDISFSFFKRISSYMHLPKLDLGLVAHISKFLQPKVSGEDGGGLTTPPSTILRADELEEILAKTATTPYRVNSKKSWQRRPSSSKESVMEVASKLPSDFFQKRGSISAERQTIYQTPSQSPSSKTVDDSSYASSNLWDQFDELPSTLRTEGGISTLYSRRPMGSANREETLYAPKIKNRI